MIRNVAAIRLFASGDSRLGEIAHRLLDDPEPMVVSHALEFLRFHGARSAREAVRERMGRWEDMDPWLLEYAKDLLVAAGEPEDLRHLAERLYDEPNPSWLEHAVRSMDDELRSEASSALLGQISTHPEAVRFLAHVVYLGIREHIEAITSRCLSAFRRGRAGNTSLAEVARALDIDGYLQANLTHALRPRPNWVPFDDGGDPDLVPVEPDPDLLRQVCARIGPLGDRFLRMYRPEGDELMLGEVGAWAVEAAEAASRRNPAFSRAAAQIAGLGSAAAKAASNPVPSCPATQDLLSMLLLLLVRATWGHSPRDEIPLLGPDPSPETLLELHRGETVSLSESLTQALAGRVAPEALIESLSHESVAVAFRAARALVLGHGDRYLADVERIFERSRLHAGEFVEFARRQIGESALLTAARLFLVEPGTVTAGVLARTCAALATERSRAVFRRYLPAFLRLADIAEIGLAVLVLGDREVTEEYLDKLVEFCGTHEVDVDEAIDDYLKAMGLLYGIEARIRKVRKVLFPHGTEEEYWEEQERKKKESGLRLPELPPLPPVAKLERKKAQVGRNDPCPCGSGKKFKKCCGRG